jgi:hypothetical protein
MKRFRCRRRRSRLAIAAKLFASVILFVVGGALLFACRVCDRIRKGRSK